MNRRPPPEFDVFFEVNGGGFADDLVDCDFFHELRSQKVEDGDPIIWEIRGGRQVGFCRSTRFRERRLGVNENLGKIQ